MVGKHHGRWGGAKVKRYCYSICAITTADVIMIKAFILGTVVGVAVAATPAYNYGRGAPLLSNPFQERTVGTIVGEAARNVAADVKKGIRELAK
jgi:hypothetical protein